MPNWEEIQREWESSEITFKELAEKHDVKDSTIHSRKNRENWQRTPQRKRTDLLRRKAAILQLRKRKLHLLDGREEVAIPTRRINLRNGTGQQ